MKELVAKIKQYWINRPIYKTWESMPDNFLFLFFVLSSLPEFYWAYVLKQLCSPYIEAVNSVGFNFIGVIVTFFMLAFALQAWVFRCIAKRTGGLVYDRWFK